LFARLDLHVHGKASSCGVWVSWPAVVDELQLAALELALVVHQLLRFNFEQSSRLTPDRGFIFDFVSRQISARSSDLRFSRSNSSGVSLANWLAVRFNFQREAAQQSSCET
jgi:hypothetical protein